VLSGGKPAAATMQSGTRALVPLLRASDNFTTWSEKLVSALMLAQPEPLDKFLTKEPDSNVDQEVKQDRLCLATIKLYIHESLSTVIRSCKTAKAAYDALQRKLLHALEIRRQSCHTSIAALKQGKLAIADYLDTAHLLMCEAQDVEQKSLMALLCTQVITGLRAEYLQALGDSLLSQVETSLKADSTEDEIMSVFTTIDQRIRARCKQYLSSMQATEASEEDKAAMYNVQQDAQERAQPKQPANPQKSPKPQQKRDRSNDQCNYCGLMGHWKNECPDFRQHRANQQRLRRDERKMRNQMQLQHMNHRGQPAFIPGPQTPQFPLQLAPMANMMGYVPSQSVVGMGFQDQMSASQQSAMGSVYNMQSPSLQQSSTIEIQNLRDQVSMLRQQLQSMQGPCDLPGGGHARMYAAEAVVHEVHQGHHSITDIILDGGTTHHVARSPCLLFSLRSSHINSVLVAGGESHEVIGQGDMLLHTPHGDTTIRDVLCVPSFVVNLMSESQIDESGGSVFKRNAKAVVKDVFEQPQRP
jgi:hypothetical protein